MASKMKREAATLLILSKSSSAARLGSAPELPHAKQILEDYSVLLLKRSSQSRFLPSARVFPGGAWDAADGSPSWLQVFGSCGLTTASLHQHFRLSDSVRAPVYSRLSDKMASSPQPASGTNPPASEVNPSPLEPEVSLRITALRETFEETGLLLAVPVKDGVRQTPLAITENEIFRITSEGAQSVYDSDGDRFSIDRLAAETGHSFSRWREQVQGNPSKFVDLFASSCAPREGGGSGLLPWVWGLVEWWSWLTPTTFPAKRYDTMFYTALLPELAITPEMFSHCDESDDLLVAEPSVVVQEWLAGNGWLAPPQVYELGRLGQFPSLQELQQHVRRRVGQGVTAAAVDTWVPQMYTADDGTLSVLPGDVLYSSNYSGTAGNMPILAGTLQQHRCNPSSVQVDGGAAAAAEGIEDRNKHVPLNRMEMSGLSVCSLMVNVEPRYGQVIPVDIVKRLKKNELLAKLDPLSSL